MDDKQRQQYVDDLEAEIKNFSAQVRALADEYGVKQGKALQHASALMACLMQIDEI